MKRSGRPPGTKGPPRSQAQGTPPPAPSSSRRTLGRIGTIALIALPIIIAALLLRPRGDQRPGGAGGGAIAGDQAILDSLKAADGRRDWVAAVLWAERLGAKRPRSHGVLLARGTAWSNYAIDQRRGRLRPRPALRTSLERMECLSRALALMDSSAMAAPDSARWVDSGVRMAQLDETIGLWGDALISYELIKQRLPKSLAPALRAYWVRALMYDPVHPDTSEWDRYMRSTGRR